MALTDTAIRKAKPGKHPSDPEKNGRAYKLADAGGLYLYVAPSAAKSWRLKYRFDGKERSPLTFGLYPTVGLAEARAKREAARTLLAAGVDPGEARKAAKASRAAEVANTFESIAREWFAARRNDWSASYGDKVMRRLEVDVFPYIGRSPVADVTPPQLLAVMRRIESRGVIETAHRALEGCGQVFRYAVATGRAPSSPARDLKGALRRPDSKHFPAIVDPVRLGQLLRACDAYAGTPVVRAALQLAPMLMLRPGELRFADWCEFDLDAAVWTVPPARMKRVKRDKISGDAHVVPLPSQAVALLRDLHELTGPVGYVFRGERHHDRAMSNNTVNAALRAMGFPKDEVVGHGFRATARTMQRERLGIPPEVSEAQLAHSVRDPLGRAYNRAQFAQERRVMMQVWADYLGLLREGGETSFVQSVPDTVRSKDSARFQLGC